ncbi:MAG: ATP-binding cassette domain-containing protein [Clostridiaceae bacterium]|jgi:oligopeptide/dipeptide ABC transporter ATP-binding protein|nr:ATP-binding cassette domain-containing protein [Clostridiaceae bacterium]
MSESILRVEDLKKHYPIKKGFFNRQVGTKYVVDGISFDIKSGETVALIGESGCGKTVLLRVLLGLEKQTSGKIFLKGIDISTLSKRERKKTYQKLGMIFQDTSGSMHPRMTIEQILEEALYLVGDRDRKSQYQKVTDVLLKVGLDPAFRNRLPIQLSGGQRQRVVIARALIINPAIVLADEPVSALDVSLQAQVLNLFMDLQENENLSMLFVAHDLAVVRQIAHRILIMYMGHILEEAPSNEIYSNAKHPYTKVLLIASPSIAKGINEESFHVGLKVGDTPDPANPPQGCLFCTRCMQAMERCYKERPERKEVSPGHFVCCHLIDEEES